jgi:hypothetical protein
MPSATTVKTPLVAADKRVVVKKRSRTKSVRGSVQISDAVIAAAKSKRPRSQRPKIERD